MIAQSDATEWPEAAIAIAGIVLVIAVVVMMIWQGAATLRARANIQRDIENATIQNIRAAGIRASLMSPTNSLPRAAMRAADSSSRGNGLGFTIALL